MGSSREKWILVEMARRVGSPRVAAALVGVLGLVVLAGTPLPLAAARQRIRPAVSLPPAACRRSAAASIEYLREVMDAYHDRVPVYEDVSSAGNHFKVWAPILPEGGDPAAASVDPSSQDNPHSGATAIRAEFRSLPSTPFGGFVFQNGCQPAGGGPVPNWGTEPAGGFDLRGATELTFWARGETGQEQIQFFMGGVGRDTGAPYPDSAFRRAGPGVTRLSTAWRQYRIPLDGLDLRSVLGGFGWVAARDRNPHGAVFHIDDIECELSPAARAARLQLPRFLRSFTTLPVQSTPTAGSLDLAFRNAAITYDNALAVLAFLADGSPDSLRRAQLIGDALVYVRAHDRYFTDRGLRSMYSAGDLWLPPCWTPNGRAATAAIPGFFDGQNFHEIGQEAIDTGNNAWVMLALEALYENRQTRKPEYLAAAQALGRWIQDMRDTGGTYEGFLGGLECFGCPLETPDPPRRPFASSEHNLDVHAAFTTAAGLDPDVGWAADAALAARFVEQMWNGECYFSGTLDRDHRNENGGQLALDVQAWGILALPLSPGRRAAALACAERHHALTHHGFTGFDFNDDRDGVWFEGTAQMATAYLLAGRVDAAQAYRQQLCAAQGVPDGDGLGVIAACHDGVTTGFGFSYYRRLHVGATAWNVFAQLGYNPFYARRIARGS